MKTKTVIKHANAKLPATHPGEMLREEWCKHWTWMEWTNLPTGSLAYIRKLCQEKMNVDDDIAAGLSKITKTTSTFWLNLQATYDQRKKK